MFKLTRENLFLTRFHPRHKILNLLAQFLTQEQLEFLKDNWYSVDGLELIKNKVILYEIKTRNRYKVPLWYKPKTTSSTINIYSDAIKLGFTVKTVFVWLEEDWNYSLEIKEFDLNRLHEDKPKLYDKQ